MKKLLFLATLSMSGVAQAHGLHAPVEPQVHALVHLLQFAGVLALAIVLATVARRRRSSR